MLAKVPGIRSFGERIGAWLLRHAAELVACAVAVAWFFYLGYEPTLRPTRIRWMMRDDWSAYFWGFAFFRNASWAWPLGAIPELFWPFGTSVGFTDANPWVALLFKALSPWLPLKFQYHGMWFLLCFVLQALFGARIAAALTSDKPSQALGGALFAVTPLLPSRHPHIALCAFFFVTAGVWLHLEPVASRARAKSLLYTAIALLAWAAGTHGYLSVMLLALVLALCVRLSWCERVLRAHEAAIGAMAALAVTVFVYWIFGYIGWKSADLTAEGFGEFSGDLSALFNPQGWSRWFGSLPFMPRQWEGFAYLGTGIFLLLAWRIVLWLRSPRATWQALRRQLPLLITLAALWFYSLSSRVSWLGEEVLSLHALYDPFQRLTGVFRSSGRFAWPLHMALIAAAISGCAALRSRWVGRAALLVALAVQVAELDETRLSFHSVPLDPLGHPAWASVGDHYRHLALVPIHLLWVCRYDPYLVNRLSYEAYRRRLTFNSGNFMRKEPGVEALCERHVAREQGIDDETVYVVDPRFRRDFPRNFAECGRLDGMWVCVSNARETPLLQALRRHPL